VKHCLAQALIYFVLFVFQGNSLVFLTFHLLNQYGLIELFQLDMVKVRQFLGKSF